MSASQPILDGCFSLSDSGVVLHNSDASINCVFALFTSVSQINVEFEGISYLTVVAVT